MKKILSSIVALAAFAGAAGVALAMPDTETDVRSANAYTAQGGTISLVCTGGIERTLESGIDAATVEENISGSAGLLILDGEGEWFGAQQASDPGDSRSVSGVLEASGETSLGAPQLRGTLTLSGADADRAVVAGSSNHLAQAGDLRGLAINPCTWADSTQWLVGGSAAVGSSNRLLLTNPGRTPVTVRVEAFSSTGPMDLGSSENVVIGPHGSEEYVLDGLIEPDERIALRLSAESGTFGATMQTTSLDGFSPAGVSAISPGASGSTITIPGVLIEAAKSSGYGEILADPNHEARLRIVNPTEETATVSVFIQGDAGKEELPGGRDVDVIPGGVLDLTLEGLAPGVYDVVIESQTNISGAVSLGRVSADGTDLAWASAQPTLTRGAAAYTGDASLSLSGTGDVTWMAFDANGEKVGDGRESLDGTTALVNLPQSTYLSVDSDTPIRAAVVAHADVEGGQGIAWVPVVAHGAAAQSLRVAVNN